MFAVAEPLIKSLRDHFVQPLAGRPRSGFKNGASPPAASLGGSARSERFKYVRLIAGGGDEMEEKVYYRDENVKVTDLRITARNVTVPIERIEKIMVNFKATRLAVSFGAFMLSIVFVWVGCYFYNHLCLFGILIVIASLAYFINVCRTYVELKISTAGSRSFILLNSGMNNSEYIYGIVEALEQSATLH